MSSRRNRCCCAAWPEAVGKKIAGHTRAAKLVRTRLVVEVEDHTWQRQLFALTPHILSNLDKHAGARAWWKIWSSASCRGGASRHGARQAVPALFADDADAIADPVHARISTSSRGKRH